MKPSLKKTYNLQLLIICIFALVGFQDAYSQCPVITNNIQSFCDLDEPSIADLVVTDAGNGVVWYETATSTTALDLTDGLENGEDYFADDATGSCGTRESVTVTIYGAPTGFNFQGVCVENPNEATISDLEAFGNDVQWYDVFEGGIPLSGATLVADDTIYYADQANPDTGCRTSRLSVLVNIGIVPVPTGNAIQEFCSSDTPTVADLAASGNNNWYDSVSSVVPLDPSTLLVNGQSYFATTVDPPCESNMRFEVTVQMSLGPEPGISSNIDICATGSPEDLFTALGGTPDTGGTWSPALASGSGIFDPTLDAAGTYTYTVIGIPPCNDASATVTVVIVSEPNAGTNGSLDFCENDNPQDLFDALGGTPETGGTWSPALASGTGVFDPNVDTAGIYTYTVNGTPCADATAEVTVAINPEANPGTNGSLDICNFDTPVDLFTILGGTPELGGTWSPVLASGTGIFDPSIDVAGIYTYTVSGTPPCGDASASVTVVILPEPNAGTDGSLEICSNDNSQDLFNALGGTPETGGVWSPSLASGTGIFNPSIDAPGIYTYTLTGAPPCGDATSNVTVTIIPEADPGVNSSLTFCSNGNAQDLFNALGGTPESGGTWSPALASGTGIFDPTIDSEGTYTYTVNGTAPCSDASATVTVIIEPEPDAGLDGAIDICSIDATQDLFNALNGTPQTGGTWSPALASGTGVFDPAIDTAGIYTYTLNGAPPCGSDSATVTVSITIAPDPGTNGNLDICISDNNPQDLFNALGGTPESGGTWSPALASGTGIFDPTVDAEGIYTYTLSGIAPCGDTSATVTVIIVPDPDAGLDGAIDICSIDATQDLFNALNGTPQTGGTWSPALASGTGVFDPAIDTDGIYTYTVNGTPPCGSDSATVTVSITLAPNPGTNGNLDICNNDSPQDLFNALGGTPESGGTWSPALASGTGIFDPTVDAEGIYTYTLSGIAPCGDTSATVTVIIVPDPDAGLDGAIDICSIDATQDLFNALNGTPQTGGTWSPALASGTGVFDPAIDTDGIYTYTVNGTPPCGSDSATVTVSITLAPNPGTNGNLDICNNDSPQDLFNALGGTPETGGTWSPALASGTGIFNPASDTEGIYTYTLSGIAPCGDISATVTVTIIPEPNAGIDSIGTVCIDDGPQDLFNFLDGSPEAGGTWSPALNSGTGIFDPTSDSEGIYTYTVSGPVQCGQTATATLTVTIAENPNLSRMILELNSICLGENNTVTLTNATLVPDGDYMLTYLLSGANDIEQTIEINFVSGATSFEIPASILINSGNTTLTLTDFFSSTSLCGADASVIDPVDFTVFDSPTPSLIENGNTFCTSDNATIADLSANIIDSGTIVWYDALSNGNAYDNGHALENGETYYASLTTGDGCTSLVRLEVTITIEICEEFLIPDGFSPNGDSVNDTFFIRNLRVLYPDFNLEIFNRYGNVLYKGNKNSADWDGRNNENSEAPVGVYFYILKFNDGTRDPVQGRVYLSR